MVWCDIMGMSEFVLYTDGGYRMAQNVGAWAWVLIRDGFIVAEDARGVRDSTSNQCEYYGLLNGLEKARFFTDRVVCRSDSQLVIQQLNGKYKVNNEALKVLNAELLRLSDRFEDVRFVWNGRDSNSWTQYCDKKCDYIIDKSLMI